MKAFRVRGLETKHIDFPEDVPKPMAPGVYFGLPEQTYHADPSYSASGALLLYEEPADFWKQSRFNLLREEFGHDDEESSALRMGRAAHWLVSQDAKTFDDFFVEPFVDTADRKKTPKTIGDLNDLLNTIGQRPLGTVRKEQLVEKCRLLFEDFQTYEEAQYDYAESTSLKGQTILTRAEKNTARMLGSALAANPETRKCFIKGYSEVSIFWIRDGVPRKARIDYVKAKTLVDLKLFSVVQKSTTEQAILNRFGSFKQYVQVAQYVEASEMIHRFLHEGMVYGDVSAEFSTEFRKHRQHFTFVYQKMSNPFVQEIMMVDRDSDLVADGSEIIEYSAGRYKYFAQNYGTMPWKTPTQPKWIKSDDIAPHHKPFFLGESQESHTQYERILHNK